MGDMPERPTLPAFNDYATSPNGKGGIRLPGTFDLKGPREAFLREILPCFRQEERQGREDGAFGGAQVRAGWAMRAQGEGVPGRGARPGAIGIGGPRG